MLVGVGGSGRKSLATLSAYIAFDMELYKLEMNKGDKWEEVLQNLMKFVGLDP